MYKNVLMTLVAAIFVTSALDAITFRVGPRQGTYHERHYWDDDYYGGERLEHRRYFLLRDSTRIERIIESDERTRIELRNGMEFRIRATELPFEEGDRVNVYSKRTDEGRRYQLVIHKERYRARRLN